jgi:hypothetical protein
MKLLDDRMIADFLRRFSLAEYRPADFRYEVTRIYDTQPINATADATPIDFFNTATSNRADHAENIAGCNLETQGRLPGNTSFIVVGIELQALQVVTTAKANDAQLFAEYGYVDGLYVKRSPRLAPMLAGPAMVDRGTQPILTGLASAATAVTGVAGRGGGLSLTPESFVTIANGEEFYLRVGFAGAGNLSVALAVRASLVGLKIEAKGSAR